MAFVRYTVLRLLLLLAVAGLLWVVGFRGLWLLLVAIFTSGLISLFVLSRSRDAASSVLYNRVQTIRERLDDQTAAEDAWDDQQRASGTSNDQQP